MMVMTMLLRISMGTLTSQMKTTAASAAAGLTCLIRMLKKRERKRQDVLQMAAGTEVDVELLGIRLGA